MKSKPRAKAPLLRLDSSVRHSLTIRRDGFNFYPIQVSSLEVNGTEFDTTIHRFDDLHGTVDGKERLDRVAACRQESLIRCLCTSETRCELYLRQYGDVPVLAKYGKSGGEHAEDCIFREDRASESASFLGFGLSGTHADTDINLGSLRFRTKTAKPKQTKVKRRPRGKRNPWHGRASMLAGVVAKLLHVSLINIHDPSLSQLEWTDVAARLSNAAALIRTDDGRLNLALSITRDGIEAEIEARLARLSAADREANKHLLIMGNVVRVDAINPEQVCIFLQGYEQPIKINAQSWAYAKRHSTFRGAGNALCEVEKENARMRVLALFAVSRDDNSELTATRVGLVVTTPQWIPVASWYELSFAELLVREQRYFLKPLFRELGDRFLHDFVLLDLDRNYPIEVNGMSRLDHYVEYKRRVTEYLNSEFGGHHAIWLADQGAPMPDLPSPALNAVSI